MDFVDLEEDLIEDLKKPNPLIDNIETQDYDADDLAEIFLRTKTEIDELNEFKRYIGEKLANIAFDDENGIAKTKLGNFKPRRNGIKKVWAKDRALEAAYQTFVSPDTSPRDILNFILDNFNVSPLERNIKKLGLKPTDYYKEEGEEWWTVDQK